MPQAPRALLSRDEWVTRTQKSGTSAGALVKAYTSDIVKAADSPDGGRVRTFTITTGNPDREKDVINPDGWMLANYRNNPVVLFAHDYRSLPVGKGLNIRQGPGSLIADVEFPPPGVYAFADTVLGMIDFGALKATSVGFDPAEWTIDEQRGGYNFIRQELLEFSIVPVPANAEALQLALKGMGASIGPYKAWVHGAAEMLKAAETEHPGEPVAATITHVPNGFNISTSVDWKDFALKEPRPATPIPPESKESPMIFAKESHVRRVGDTLDVHPFGLKAGCCLVEAPAVVDKAEDDDVLIFDLDALRAVDAPAEDDALAFTKDDLQDVFTEMVGPMVAHAVEARFRALTGRLD